MLRENRGRGSRKLNWLTGRRMQLFESYFTFMGLSTNYIAYMLPELGCGLRRLKKKTTIWERRRRKAITKETGSKEMQSRQCSIMAMYFPSLSLCGRTLLKSWWEKCWQKSVIIFQRNHLLNTASVFISLSKYWPASTVEEVIASLCLQPL